MTGATITAVRAGGGAIRATLSSNDGVYSFADLPPGAWSLALQLRRLPACHGAVLAGRRGQGHALRRGYVHSERGSCGPQFRACTACGRTRAAGRSAAPVAPTAAAATVAAIVPEALQAPEPGPEVDTKTPWAQVGYVGWMNGTSREKAPIFDTKFFTPEIRFDMNYLQSLQPSASTTPSSARPRSSAPANSRSNR